MVHISCMRAPGTLTVVILMMVISFCAATGHSKWLDPEEGPEEVDCKVDISDIMDYDPVTQTSARCEKMKRDRQKARETCTSDLAEAKRQLEGCRSGRGLRGVDCPPAPPCVCQKQGGMEDTCIDPARADNMFFFRLTRHLVNILQDKAPDSGPVEAQIEVHLTSHEWKKLQRFVEDQEKYRKADIHDILVGMTIEIFLFNQTSMLEWIGEQINFKSPGIALLLMSVLVVTLVFGVGMYSDLYWNRRFLGCLLLAVFVISLVWNWIFLYQEETIKRYRNAQQYEDIPPSCLPHEMTWSQALGEWYRTTWTVKTDPCLNYHMMYLVDPLLDIPPSRALSFTISSFFVDPMKYAGRAFSEFHAEIFRNLPLWVGCLALVSFYITLFVLLYAFIAAPRRVQREHPQAMGFRRREEQHRAMEGRHRRQLQFERQHQDVAEEDHDDHEGDRVENIPPAPTLPPMAKEKEQGPPPEQRKPVTPLGTGVHDIVADPEDRPNSKARSQREMGKRVVGPKSPAKGSQVHRLAESKDHPAPSGYTCSNRSSETLPVTDQPAVRQKERHTRMPPHWDDGGDEMDISSLSSFEASGIQRPTGLPDTSSTRTKHSPPTTLKRATSVGSTESGNVTAHPASERSDGESLVSSVADPNSLQETEASVCSGGVKSSGAAPLTTECASPISADSPSDYSIISPSPENTNSATYEFISTSSIGLSEGEDSSQSQIHQEDQHGNDYDDDFVVLKKETQ